MDHAEADFAAGAIARGPGANLVVARDLYLLVAFQFQRTQRVPGAVLGIDQVPGAFEITPAERRGPGVLGLAQAAVAVRGAGRSEERRGGKECVSPGRTRVSAYH